jgi:uncharacterized protein (DUF4415 family)
MNHKVTLLEDDDYDLDDDIAPEYDLSKLPRATEQERKYRAQAQRRVVQLDADVLEFFKTPEAVNEALRRVMREVKEAA